MFTVNDSAGVLTAAQRSELVATNASSSVVVNLVNTGSQGELDALTQKCVTTPNTLCIGRDNAHKWTSVHPGIDLGIKGDAAVEVRKAGNADFRQGDLVGGLKAIVSRSEAVRLKQNQTAVIVEHQVVRHETTYWPLFVIGGGLIALVVYFVFKAKRSAKKAEDAMRVATMTLLPLRLEEDPLATMITRRAVPIPMWVRITTRRTATRRTIEHAGQFEAGAIEQQD
jgi:hypothetical protein